VVSVAARFAFGFWAPDCVCFRTWTRGHFANENGSGRRFWRSTNARPAVRPSRSRCAGPSFRRDFPALLAGWGCRRTCRGTGPRLRLPLLPGIEQLRHCFPSLLRCSAPHRARLCRAAGRALLVFFTPSGSPVVLLQSAAQGDCRPRGAHVLIARNMRGRCTPGTFTANDEQ
jgi:hypothetical protein